MSQIRISLAVISLLAASACSDQGPAPQPLLPGAPRFSLEPGSSVVGVNFASVATGVDNGEQDGVYDEFTTLNMGSVNNNGYTSFRTGVEFSLSAVPTGATVNSARLTVAITNWEGERSIQVHGHAGDGTVDLGDFALEGLVGTTTLEPIGSQSFTLDVTPLIAGLVTGGAPFAGFNLREEPANTSNFLVMFMDLGAAPVLTIDLSTGLTVAVDIKPGGADNRINPRSEGKIPVAILSSATFDAPGSVNPTSLTFGRTGDERSLAFCDNSPEDVNGDRLFDLVCHFTTRGAVFLSGDTKGVLKGRTRDGISIAGSDAVRIVP